MKRPAFPLGLMLPLALAGAAALAQVPAGDAPLAPAPAAPAVSFLPHPGDALPLDAAFTDSGGRLVRLGDELGPRATLLMLGWHRCPQLCGLATQGLLEALRQGGVPASAARIVFVSVDPAETAADAAERRRADLGYARLLAGHDAGAPPDVERLVGPLPSIRALARGVGFTWQPGDARARLAHPAGVVVVTPGGRVSRALMGVRFDAAELRSAIDDAAAGRIGTLGDRIALLCAHLDPHAGRHDGAVMMLARVAGLATLVALGLFAWRRRRLA
ncbi:MAG: SCO family protein [Burkholderiales bacterium]|nr:SCO family protein [Burkholderiales bacterium]